MCERYLLDVNDCAREVQVITDTISTKEQYAGMNFKTGEISPSDLAAVYKLGWAVPEAAIMRWGFPIRNKNKVIPHVWSETAKRKQAYSEQLRYYRVVVPATGFYLTEGGKEYLFKSVAGEMLYMAGFYANFDVEDELRTHFVILTSGTDQHENNMPILLNRDEIREWLLCRLKLNTVAGRDEVGIVRVGG